MGCGAPVRLGRAESGAHGGTKRGGQRLADPRPGRTGAPSGDSSLVSVRQVTWSLSTALSPLGSPLGWDSGGTRVRCGSSHALCFPRLCRSCAGVDPVRFRLKAVGAAGGVDGLRGARGGGPGAPRPPFVLKSRVPGPRPWWGGGPLRIRGSGRCPPLCARQAPASRHRGVCYVGSVPRSAGSPLVWGEQLQQDTVLSRARPGGAGVHPADLSPTSGVSQMPHLPEDAPEQIPQHCRPRAARQHRCGFQEGRTALRRSVFCVVYHLLQKLLLIKTSGVGKARTPAPERLQRALGHILHVTLRKVTGDGVCA